MFVRKQYSDRSEIKIVIQLQSGEIISVNDNRTTVQIWSEELEPNASCECDASRIYEIAELKDGKLISRGTDHSIKLWTLSSDEMIALEGERGKLLHFMELEGGKIITRSHQDAHSIRVWNTQGELLAAFCDDHIKGFLEGPNDTLITWCCNHHNLQIWSTRVENEEEDHFEHRIVDNKTEQDKVFISYNKNTIRLWTSSGKVIKNIAVDLQGLGGAILTNCGRVLCWAENSFRLYCNDGKTYKEFTGHSHLVKGIIHLKNGHILSWSIDGTAKIWSMGGKLIYTYAEHEEVIDGAQEIVDNCVVTWSFLLGSGSIDLWHASGHRIDSQGIRKHFIRGVLKSDFSDDIIYWDAGGYLHYWCPNRLYYKSLNNNAGNICGAMNFDEGILGWNDQGCFEKWTKNYDYVGSFEGHSSRINGVMSIAPNQFLSWGYDGTIRHWSKDFDLISLWLWPNAGIDYVQKIDILGHKYFVQAGNDVMTVKYST